MYTALNLALVIVCFWVSADSVPAPSKKGIIYSTKRGMPSNIHYIVKIGAEVERKAEESGRTVKPSCAYARKAGSAANPEDGKNLTKSGEVEDECLKASGIITAPSRTNDDSGYEDCIGRNRRKDLNGLCRKIWD